MKARLARFFTQWFKVLLCTFFGHKPTTVNKEPMVFNVGFDKMGVKQNGKFHRPQLMMYHCYRCGHMVGQVTVSSTDIQDYRKEKKEGKKND